MNLRYPTGTDEEREKAISVASLSIQRGELIVLPTDTVYGLAADAFDADAVADLLAAKGRGREMPPPVLVSSPSTLDALAVRVPTWARALVERFWPGPLTIVCHQQASLQWDLGDTRGTVAIRMPDHDIAREILERTGPLAVSSANLTGRAAAVDAEQAEQMLGEEVAAIVDAGPAPGGEASTIVDATGDVPRVLREGALSADDLDTVLRPLGLALSGLPPEVTDAGESTEADDAADPTESTDAADPTQAAAPTTARRTGGLVERAEPVAPEDGAEATATTASSKPSARKAGGPARTTPATKTPAKKTAAKKTAAGTTAKAPARKTAVRKTAATGTARTRKTTTTPAADPAAQPKAEPPAEPTATPEDDGPVV